jgi:hypothetical protein
MMVTTDARRAEDLEEVGKRRARDVVIRDMYDIGEILIFELLSEVRRVLCEKVERDPEERALNLESPRSAGGIVSTQTRTLIFTISSRMYSVGCSSKLFSNSFAKGVLFIAGISSKDMSEEEMLLIVGVGGSGGRFSMAS